MGVIYKCKYLLWVVFLLGFYHVNAQQAKITIVDSKTLEPIVFAHVCFEDLKTHAQRHTLTDEKGCVVNTCGSTAQIAVSYIGYKTLYDTLVAEQSYTLKLVPTVVNIDEVVVTGQYAPERVDKSIYPIKVLNSKQMEFKAANNLTELLKGELNMRTSTDGVLGSSISLQGLSGENVKLLIDGVPVIGRMNGNIDLSQINLNNIDHVEVIDGPMSVVYGSNALAGVINLITKENKNTRMLLDANTYYESVGVYNADASFSAKKKNHVLTLNGGRNFFGGYSNPDTSRAKQWKPKRQLFINGDYIYSKDKLKIKFGNQYFNELLLNKGNLVPLYFETAFDSYFYTKRYVSRLDFASPIGNNRFFNALISYSWFLRIKQTYYKDLTTLEEFLTPNSDDQDTTRFENWLGRFTYSKSNKSSTLNYQVGIDATFEQGHGKRIVNDVQQIGDYAGFLSIKYEPFGGLVLQPGARYGYNTRYAPPIVYSLNVKWDPLEYYTVRASYARGFRAPSLKELYLYFVDVNHNVRGNENLKAEYSHNFNLSISYNREMNKQVYSAEFAAFYNSIENVISLANLSKDLYTYFNIDKFNSLGFMFTTTYRFYPSFMVKAGLSHTGRKNYVAEFQNNNQFAFSTDFNLESSYTWLNSGLTLAGFYKFTGRLPQFYINPSGDLDEGFISAYHTLDISLVKNLFKKKVSATIGAKNLFDVSNVMSMGSTGAVHGSAGSGAIPMGWGRSFFIKLTVHLYQYEQK